MPVRRDKQGKFAQDWSGKNAPGARGLTRPAVPSSTAPSAPAAASPDYRSMYSSWMSTQPAAASAPNRGPSPGYVAPLPRYRGVAELVSSFDMRAAS